LERQKEITKKKYRSDIEELKEKKNLTKCHICQGALEQDVVQINCNTCDVKIHSYCWNEWKTKNTEEALTCPYCSAKIPRTNRGLRTSPSAETDDSDSEIDGTNVEGTKKDRAPVEGEIAELNPPNKGVPRKSPTAVNDIGNKHTRQADKKLFVSRRSSRPRIVFNSRRDIPIFDTTESSATV
jgi:hypothetical protein